MSALDLVRQDAAHLVTTHQIATPGFLATRLGVTYNAARGPDSAVAAAEAFMVEQGWIGRPQT